MSAKVRVTRSTCPIAYVDDSQDDHFLLHHAVLRSKTPLQIQPFFHGETLIACLKHEHPFESVELFPPPHLILCDYDLGTTSGDHLVATIRSIPNCANLPIIVFSGSECPDSVAESYQAGADHFLCKPSTAERLAIIVQTLFACAASNPRNFDAITGLLEYQPRPTTGLATSVAPPLASSSRASNANIPQHHSHRLHLRRHPP